MSLAVTTSCQHIYQGNSVINFFDDEDGLSVTIDTERLHMRSVRPTEEEYDLYAALCGCKDVMEKFSAGETKSREEVKTWIEKCSVNHWRKHDPYTGLSVFQNDADCFLGHVILGLGDAPGESEVSYLFNRSCWKQGYGSEAVRAVVKEYAPATVKKGYLLDGKPLERIVATARPDNPASIRILEKVGLKFVRQEEKYGAMRNHYLMHLNAMRA